MRDTDGFNARKLCTIHCWPACGFAESVADSSTLRLPCTRNAMEGVCFALTVLASGVAAAAGVVVGIGALRSSKLSGLSPRGTSGAWEDHSVCSISIQTPPRSVAD